MLLATLKEYKEYNSISSPNKDTQIELLLEASSSYIKNYCGMSFIDYYSTSKTEYLDGTCKEALLTELPIKEVVSVKTSVDGGVTQTTLVENTDYFVNKESSIVIAVDAQFVYPIHDFKSLEIVYTAGYLKPPKDITLATIELAEYYKDEEYTPRRSLGSASVENTIAISKSIPTHIKIILDSYRIL